MSRAAPDPIPAGAGRTVRVGPGVRQGLWLSFGVQDGVPSSIITSILEDREGCLWFGTRAGVCRYDGAQFTTFSTEDGLASQNVGSMLEDREGNLWLGTGVGEAKGEGLSRYDGREFVIFTRADGLAGNTVMVILEDRQGCLWFGTAEGLSRYDGREFVTFTRTDGLADNNVYSLLEDGRDHLWIGTQSGVSRYDGIAFENFTTQEGLADNVVTSMLEDREGNLWFGTGWYTAKGGGVSRYDGREFVTFTRADGLAGNAVPALWEDRQGQLWLGTWGDGVSRYDGEKFTTFTSEDGLADNKVLALLEDRQGNMWVGTYGGGVSRYLGQALDNFTRADGLAHPMVKDMLADREGDLWFGTREGLSRYDGTRFDTLTTADGLVHNSVLSLMEDRQGHLWVGTDGGLSRYDGKEFQNFTVEDGLASNHVWSMLQDRQGNLWFGTDEGLSRYDGRQFVSFTRDDGLEPGWVCALLEDRQGQLWIGSSNGLSRNDGERFTTLTAGDGLPETHVYDVYALLDDRQGQLWIGSFSSGVCRYDGRGVSPSALAITIEDGLADNMVMAIYEDRQGHLWFGTYGGGVSRFDGLILQTFSRKDGLVHDTVKAIHQDSTGAMWFATEGGVTCYRPHDRPPSVHLTDVIADRHYSPAQEIHIPSPQQLVIFEFQGRSLTTHPDSMAYVVRLEGYDPDWKPNYTERVEYHDLPLGEYTFQVKAVDRDLNYSESAQVHLIVEPDARVAGLTDALRQRGSQGEFVGESRALRRVLDLLREVAPTDGTVLILGETGTGKGLAAHTLHALSDRKNAPFITVSCGAVPETLVESELFGHERGAFTGALSRKLGKVELAEGGTLFLDEIGDLPLQAQVKLLRLLDEDTFERVGGTEERKADARMVAATNRDLDRMVAEGSFRKDLYYRIHVFPVRLPPLRDRQEDIELLALYFMQRMAAHLNKRDLQKLTPEALAVLQAHEWPGNVRELEHTVRRAVIVSPGPSIRAQDIAFGPDSAAGATADEIVSLEEYERRYIQRVLQRTGGTIHGPRGAAQLLGIPPSTLYDRMKKLGVERG